MNKIDIFLAGGGGGGGSSEDFHSTQSSYSYCGSGGGSGYTRNVYNTELIPGTYSIVVGEGGTSDSNGGASSFGSISVNGGQGGYVSSDVGINSYPGSGGSTGAHTISTASNIIPGSINGCKTGYMSRYSLHPAFPQEFTTKKFGEITGTSYCKGGSAGWNAPTASYTPPVDAAANTGDGGNGSNLAPGTSEIHDPKPGGKGGSGIVSIRSHRSELPEGYRRLKCISADLHGDFKINYQISQQTSIKFKVSNPFSTSGNGGEFIYCMRKYTTYYIGYKVILDLDSSGETPMGVKVDYSGYYSGSPTYYGYAKVLNSPTDTKMIEAIYTCEINFNEVFNGTVNSLKINDVSSISEAVLPSEFLTSDPYTWILGNTHVEDHSYYTGEHCDEVKLYELEIYTSGSLSYRLIPVLNSDNVPGLYDLVSGNFYTDACGYEEIGRESDIEYLDTVEFTDLNIPSTFTPNTSFQVSGRMCSDTGYTLLVTCSDTSALMSDIIRDKGYFNFTVTSSKTESIILELSEYNSNNVKVSEVKRKINPVT